MCRLLSNEELKEALRADYSAATIHKSALAKRKHNINAFNQIDRKGLVHNKTEKRLLMYETMKKEKVFIQFPGKEAVENPSMLLDFRPKVLLESGMFAIDLSFGAIWDILDSIGKSHNAYLSYVAAIFFRLGYLHEYNLENREHECFELTISDGRETAQAKAENMQMEWYRLSLPEDVWYTMNDKIGWIDLGNGQRISFEGFIKMVDLLFQNEDCKYYYKNVVINGKADYKYNNGRNNSSSANLLILNYLEGNVKLSKLLDAFQKSRGVPAFSKREYSAVTNGIVLNIDVRDE